MTLGLGRHSLHSTIITLLENGFHFSLLPSKRHLEERQVSRFWADSAWHSFSCLDSCHKNNEDHHAEGTPL